GRVGLYRFRGTFGGECPRPPRRLEYGCRAGGMMGLFGYFPAWIRRSLFARSRSGFARSAGRIARSTRLVSISVLMALGSLTPAYAAGAPPDEQSTYVAPLANPVLAARAEELQNDL